MRKESWVVRALTIGEGRTTVSLEARWWNALDAIVKQRKLPFDIVIDEIELSRTDNRAAAIREYILEYLWDMGVRTGMLPPLKRRSPLSTNFDMPRE